MRFQRLRSFRLGRFLVFIPRNQRLFWWPLRGWLFPKQQERRNHQYWWGDPTALMKWAAWGSNGNVILKSSCSGENPSGMLATHQNSLYFSFWAAEHCLGWWWAVGGGGAGRKKKIPNWQIIDISGSVQLCLFPAHWAFSSSLKLAGNLPHHL